MTNKQNANNDELSESLSRVMQTDAASAETVWREYFPRVLNFARKKLAGMPSRDFDEEDVALSALHSFLRGRDEAKFHDLSGDNEIWRLLVTITARKITAQRRKQFAAKRGGGKVRGESGFGQYNDAGSSYEGIAQIMDENQLPESASQVIITCEEMLTQLNDEKLQRTAVLRMEGHSNDEISE